MNQCHLALLSLFIIVFTAGCASGEHWHEPVLPSDKATVNIDAAVQIRNVPKEIFGTNIEWPTKSQRVWLDETSTLDPKVIQLSKQLGVSLVRFPGGTFSDYYNWRLGIGPLFQRPPQKEVLNPGASVNYFGTDELMSFCRSVSAAPMLTVNLITGSAQEAADWVAYCNATANADRARHGHESAYKVAFWELGNESYMKPDKPETKPSSLSAQEYVQRCNNFIAAMRKVDPTIKVAVIGGNNFTRFDFMADKNWNESVLKALGDQIDFFSVHNGYAPLVIESNDYTVEEVYAALLAFPVLIEQNLASLSKQIDQFCPGNAKNIKIAVTEWGPLFHILPTSCWLDHPKTLGSGLYSAGVLHAMLRNPRVGLATFFKLKDVLFIGTIGYDNVPKASFYTLQLYSRLVGQNIVKTEVRCPTYTNRALGLIPSIDAVPYLDVLAARSADKKQLSIFVINLRVPSSLYDLSCK